MKSSSIEGDNMQEEYDFSQAERGKFFHPNSQKNLPVYIDADVLDYYTAKAKEKGIEVDSLINDQLKKDISSIKNAK